MLPKWLRGKEFTYQCRLCRRPRRHGFNLWARKFLWRRKRQPLQNSCLEDPMIEEPGVLQSIGQTRLGDWACIWMDSVSLLSYILLQEGILGWRNSSFEFFLYDGMEKTDWTFWSIQYIIFMWEKLDVS